MEKNKPNIEIERLEAAANLGKHFIQRWDLYAQQLSDGRYFCKKEKLTAVHLLSHLEGAITLGTYLLDTNSQARFIVFDADSQESVEKLSKVCFYLDKRGVSSYLETSRRGGHLWFFFERPQDAEIARAFGKGILNFFEVSKVELYPKQDRIDEGPGSLIRLPFGVHRMSKQKYFFVTPEGKLLAPTIREQIRALTSPNTISQAMIEKFRYRPEKKVTPSLITPGETTAHIWERIKTSISVMDFVGRYVELKPTASGAVGLCPFHDDTHPSFGVNEKGNYWNCFAGCGGGSVIDFWMLWKDCDFNTAVDELNKMME